MLSRPIGPCIKKNRWIAGILSILLVRSWRRSNHALQWWAAGVVIWLPENSDFWRMDKESWERVTSVTALVIWAFRSFLLDSGRSFRQHAVSSFAWLFCTHMLQQRFLVLNSATSNLLVTSFCHWLRSFTLSESQNVSGSSWESVDPNASHYKVGFTLVQNLTSKNRHTYWPIMKCPLFASWNACTTHSLAGYTHQIIRRHRVVVRAHLDFTSSE